MILEKFEIDDDAVDEIVVRALKRLMKYHEKGDEPDSREIVAACKKIIEYYGPVK